MRSMHGKIAVLIAGLGVVIASVPAATHHAFSAEFDATKPVKLQGTVTKVEWINPHAWIHMDVKTPDGKVEQWMIEGGTPNTRRQQELPAVRHRNRCRRLPGQRRDDEGQRERHHPPRWTQTVHRIHRHRRAGRSTGTST